jgi:hypothetical protein
MMRVNRNCSSVAPLQTSLRAFFNIHTSSTFSSITLDDSVHSLSCMRSSLQSRPAVSECPPASVGVPPCGLEGRWIRITVVIVDVVVVLVIELPRNETTDPSGH